MWAFSTSGLSEFAGAPNPLERDDYNRLASEKRDIRLGPTITVAFRLGGNHR